MVSIVLKQQIKEACGELRTKRDNLQRVNKDYGNVDGFYDLREDLAALADSVLKFNDSLLDK